MVLRSVLVRFYRSFNYDYLRTQDAIGGSPPWEYYRDTLWYPHVTVPIEPSITTIVGENESGKSCLLTALEKGISGHDIHRKDFCRHSRFFSVQEGQQRYPEFGFLWSNLTAEESDAVCNACRAERALPVSQFYTFRATPERLTVYLDDAKDTTPYELDEPATAELTDILPLVFRLQHDIALPPRVPIARLADDAGDASVIKKHQRGTALLTVFEEHDEWFSTAEALTQHAPHVLSALNGATTHPAAETQRQAFDLAYDLLRKVARVDRHAFLDLQNAVAAREDAYAARLVKEINQRLDAALNFPSVWVQDEDFRLNVSLQGNDLAFAIHDRTGIQYSFDERSSGLRYFLSYYIQYLTYDSSAAAGNAILVMDEPDTFLSSRGQQDLLRIFEAFANPKARERSPVQVIYVTHSPFLVDKNHAERLRVLEKGVGEEGTRVVLDVTRNQYEPLRSAFGSFGGEAIFIGNCNLMVEGASDQILLAGAAQHLRAKDEVPTLDTLDLNGITIVQAGGANQMPYTAFLAGRGVESPAVIALLDSDDKGDTVRKILVKGIRVHKKHKALLPNDRILRVGEACQGAVTTEDLVPFELAIEATKRYLAEYSGGGRLVESLKVEAVQQHHGSRPVRALEAITKYLGTVQDGVRIQKIGFARAVVALLRETPDDDCVAQFETRVRALLRRLNQMQRRAVRERSMGQVSRRVHREAARFARDHAKTARKEEALVLLETIEELLDDSREGDTIRFELNALRRRFALNEGIAKPIAKYHEFLKDLAEAQYAGRRSVQEPVRPEEPRDGGRVEDSTPVSQAVDADDDAGRAAAGPSPGEDR